MQCLAKIGHDLLFAQLLLLFLCRDVCSILRPHVKSHVSHNIFADCKRMNNDQQRRDILDWFVMLNGSCVLFRHWILSTEPYARHRVHSGITTTTTTQPVMIEIKKFWHYCKVHTVRTVNVSPCVHFVAFVFVLTLHRKLFRPYFDHFALAKSSKHPTTTALFAFNSMHPFLLAMLFANFKDYDDGFMVHVIVWSGYCMQNFLLKLTLDTHFFAKPF